jgi:hypothetical protein
MFYVSWLVHRPLKIADHTARHRANRITENDSGSDIALS